jgi:hypothetical protein
MAPRAASVVGEPRSKATSTRVVYEAQRLQRRATGPTTVLNEWRLRSSWSHQVCGHMSPFTVVGHACGVRQPLRSPSQSKGTRIVSLTMRSATSLGSLSNRLPPAPFNWSAMQERTWSSSGDISAAVARARVGAIAVTVTPGTSPPPRPLRCPRQARTRCSRPPLRADGRRRSRRQGERDWPPVRSQTLLAGGSRAATRGPGPRYWLGEAPLAGQKR